MDKSILDMVHDSAKDLHAAGVMKETTLREFDALTFQDAEKSLPGKDKNKCVWDLEREG